MTVKNPLLASASKFAHLFSFGAKAADEKPDEMAEDRKQKEGESDDDYAARMAAMDEKEKEAAADPADPDCEEPEEEKKKEAAAIDRGMKAERKRWETVLSDKGAAGRGALACHMLATTDLDAAAILATLAVTPVAGKVSGLAARMAAEPVIAPKPGGSGGALTIAQQINAAAAAARGETKAA